MRALILIATVAAVLPSLSRSQAVGNGNNYQTPSAPNYRAPTLPPAPDYHLPVFAEPPSNSATAGGEGKLYVNRIVVNGITVFTPSVVALTVAPYEHRMVSSAELQTLRVALTRLYIDKGYINSGVLLPDQESKEGVVVYQAVEGALTRVDIIGKSKLSPHYVASRIKSHVSEPLNVSELQSSLRYLQQDPNVLRLDAALGPGDGLGQGVLRLSVQDQPRFSVGVGGDNHQSSSIGANVGTVFVGARDLTGFGDEFRGSIGRSDGNTLGSAIFTLPVSARGASFQAYYSRALAAIIEQPFKALNIKETTRTYGFSLTLPVIDRLNNRFALFLGGEKNRSFTELLGTPFSFSPGAQDGIVAITVALGGFDFLHHGASTVTDLRMTYRRGLDALGATINTPVSNDPFNPNPTGADGRFGLEQLQFIHIARLNGFSSLAHFNDRAQVLFRASGQITQRPLLSLAKFTVGGVNTVRGFPENLLVRDNGAAATLELQLPLPGFQPQSSIRNLVFAPFIDYGRSWDKVNTNPGNPLIDTTRADTLVSGGLGLLWNPFRGLDAQIYWGKSIAEKFHNDNPLPYVTHDLQFHGIHFAVNYVARW